MAPLEDTVRYIHLDSSKRDSGSHDNPKFILKRPITLNTLGDQGNHSRLRLRLTQATIPYSFYSIPHGHNNFKIGGLVLQLTPGNYNIFALIKALEALVLEADTGYTISISYDRVLNKVAISTTALPFDEISILFDNTTFYNQLGFEKGVTYHLDSENPLTSATAINTAPLNGVYVRAIGLMQTNSEESGRDSGFSDILGKVPINVNPGEVMDFEPPNPSEINVLADTIGSIELALTTRDPLSPIDLNGLDFACTIEIRYDLGFAMDFVELQRRRMKFQLEASESNAASKSN